MLAFIDAHRDQYGVESICKLLPIAPSTYYEHKARQRDPRRIPPRLQRDAERRGSIRRVWQESFRVYGARKVWKQLNREAIPVARCTVERLMRQEGLRGVVRGRRTSTTIADDLQQKPLDRDQRRFVASRPDQLWVSDFYLRGDLVRVHIRRFRDRRLCTTDRRLASQPLDAHRVGVGCPGAGTAWQRSGKGTDPP
jgi:putative transposase